MTLLSAVEAVEDTPVDRWLAAQADLTAVERFSQRHQESTGPVQARYYRDLLPATAPAPGQQYGFAVDLDTCTGCKACVAACHSLNGLDDDEAWRKVSRIMGIRDEKPFQQTVTAACHHCVDPACLNGCPVDAYEKDPVTGIVRHLDDQCIGCSYCTLSCPYEVPTFNDRLGIVRKCDMCSDRLSAGEAPACVQSCPNEAISITLVDVAAVIAATQDSVLVPGAPPSRITAPTTSYRSSRGFDTATLSRSSDDGPAHAHPPLAIMLVLTQLSVGAFVSDVLLRWLTNRSGGSVPTFDAVVIAGMGLLALAASTLHLGRPLYAYRAVIGLRHSWLSREVVAFGGFTGLAVPYAAALWFGWPSADSAFTRGLGAAVAAFGLAGIVCSVLIYTNTHRSSWRPLNVSAKFVGSAMILGLGTVAWATIVSSFARPSLDVASSLSNVRGLLAVMGAVGALKLLCELAALRHLLHDREAEAARRARLMTRDLRRVTVARFTFGLVGAVLLPLAIAATSGVVHPNWAHAVAVSVALAAAGLGEFAERTLFFTAASRPR